MGNPDKKAVKTAAKLAKKQDKARLKAARREQAAGADDRVSGDGASGRPDSTPRAADGHAPSPAVRFAESVRGAIYILLGASLAAALLLGERGAIVSLDDIIDSLFAARAGKVVLMVIALALVIYGLKNLRVVR